MPKKSLAETNPELAEQWHPTMNGDLSPNDFTKGSNKKVWWKCDKGDDHQWEASPNNRTNKKTKCPVCAGKKVVLSNCLATTNPELTKEWHPTMNGDLSPNDFTKGSNKKVWWKCDKGDDHIWVSTIKNRALLGNGCGVCGGRTVVESTSLKYKFPEIAKQWHPKKNKPLTSDKIYYGSNSSFWWKCDVASDHVWKTRVADRIDGHNCPMCSGNIVVYSNSLLNVNPLLANEWHPELNGKLNPGKFTGHSGKKVWWRCQKDNNHVWQAQINNRSVTGCPYCDLTPQSRQELTITFELIKLFKNIDPKGLKTKLNGKLRAIDIFISKLNLCIEFDGHYWHKEQEEIDKIKSEMLFDEGFKVIRVREEPLPKTQDNDIISKKPYNGKQVTNDILSMIMSIFELDAKLVSKIKEYQSKEGLQNEKGLNRYIDKILTEKAERNN